MDADDGRITQTTKTPPGAFPMNLFGRTIAASTLALTLGLAFTAAPARAQMPEPPAEAEGDSSKGDPLYGYVGTAFIAALALFIVCKSARR
jgi:hypothetical protein